MDSREKEQLITDCLRYIDAARLPVPLPASAAEYAVWRHKALALPPADDDAEDAWAELYRLVDEQPAIAWELIAAIAARCPTDRECSTLAAGPFENFIGKYGAEFRGQIEDELARNEGLRLTYRWLRDTPHT